MVNTKNILIQLIERRAQRRIGELSCRLVRAGSADRENVLDEMQYQRWLAETCQDCLDGS